MISWQRLLPLDVIRPGRSAVQRVRREAYDKGELEKLARNIGNVGLIAPLLVLDVDDAGIEAMGTAYELIAGERRWRAMRKAGRDICPCVVYPPATTPEALLLELQLSENLHREGLTPIAEAEYYRALLAQESGSGAHEKLAGRLGVSRSQVFATLRLLNLPPAIKGELESRRLPRSIGAMLASQSGDVLAAAWRDIDARLPDVTARQARAIIKTAKWRGGAAPATRGAGRPEARHTARLPAMVAAGDILERPATGHRYRVAAVTDDGLVRLAIAPAEDGKLTRRTAPKRAGKRTT